MSTVSLPAEVQITVAASAPPERRGEPLTCGVPWPRGALTDEGGLSLRNHVGQRCPMQAAVLDRWSDGSVRWLLLDWQASLRDKAVYTLSRSANGAPMPAS